MELSQKTTKISKINESIKKDLEIIYPLSKSKKILLHSLSKLRVGISECINLALIIEFQRKKIKPSKTPSKNLETFFKIAKKEFKISKIEIEKIKNLLFLAKFQRESEIDFSRGKNSIFLFSQGKIAKIDLNLLKEYSILLEIILQKITIHEKLI